MHSSPTPSTSEALPRATLATESLLPQPVKEQLPSSPPPPSGEEGSTETVMYEAVYDYEGQAEGDLSFLTGNIIQVRLGAPSSFLPSSLPFLGGDSFSSELECILQVLLFPLTPSPSPSLLSFLLSPPNHYFSICSSSSLLPPPSSSLLHPPSLLLLLPPPSFLSSLLPPSSSLPLSSLQVVKQEGEWWTGVLNGVEGVFPSNYVQRTKSSPVDSTTGLQTISSDVIIHTKPVIARATIAFQPDREGQLSLQPGEYIRVHTHTHARTHAHTHTCMHTCTHACMHTHMHVRTHAHTRMHTQAHTHACTHKHTHTHAH